MWKRRASVIEPTVEQAIDADHWDRSASAGQLDAAEVIAGERCVRAILAHYAVPTFCQLYPDIDRLAYLAGYLSVPGATAPFDRRERSDKTYIGPRRRADDVSA